MWALCEGGALDCTVTVAWPAIALFSTLVAVMVAVPADADAVKSPAELMVPAVTDHVTAELKLPVPVTVGAHCDVALTLIVEGLQATWTDVMAEDGCCTVTDVLPDLLGF